MDDDKQQEPGSDSGPTGPGPDLSGTTTRGAGADLSGTVTKGADGE